MASGEQEEATDDEDGDECLGVEVVERGTQHDGRGAPEQRRYSGGPTPGAALAREKVEKRDVAASARVCTTRIPGAPTPSVPSGASSAIPGST